MLVSVFTAAGGSATAATLAHAVSRSVAGSVVFLALGLLVVVLVIGRPARSLAAAAEAWVRG